MCRGCNIHAEVIAGHLKCKILYYISLSLLAPFNDADIGITPQRNHFWNAGIVSPYKSVLIKQ
jgi:hypothetical protein